MVSTATTTTTTNNGVFSVIATAFTLGILHVLTGPDHLSAMATLSANVGNSHCKSFWLGIRWGVGHSTGLVIVGVVFIIFGAAQHNGGDDSSFTIPSTVSQVFDAIVGIFMISLGAYGIFKARRNKYRSLKNTYGGRLSEASIGDDVYGDPTDLFEDPRDPPLMHTRLSFPEPSTQYFADEPDLVEQQQQQQLSATPSSYQHGHLANSGEPEIPRGDIHGGAGTGDNVSNSSGAPATTRFLACGAGIVHGLAGPGGLLGVIPAVQLHSIKWTTLYLTTFCVISTVTMGLFAALYGSCSRCLAQRRQGNNNVTTSDTTPTSGTTGRSSLSLSNDVGLNLVLQQMLLTEPKERHIHQEFWVEFLSACLSVLVGMTWLILLCIGKLNDIFP
ncbi:hypothetical protein ACA910_010876 [Epithemia clementina (nom. ined.)]